MDTAWPHSPPRCLRHRHTISGNSPRPNTKTARFSHGRLVLCNGRSSLLVDLPGHAKRYSYSYTKPSLCNGRTIIVKYTIHNYHLVHIPHRHTQSVTHHTSLACPRFHPRGRHTHSTHHHFTMGAPFFSLSAHISRPCQARSISLTYSYVQKPSETSKFSTKILHIPVIRRALPIGEVTFYFFAG
jgi:hypothetical protein